MANKLRGEVTLKMSDVEYTLRPTFGALCELEDRSGKSILQIMANMQAGNVTLKEIVQIIWSGILGFDKDSTVTIDEVGELVLKTGLMNIMEQKDFEGINPITKYVLNGMLGGEDIDETAKKLAENQEATPKSKKKRPS